MIAVRDATAADSGAIKRLIDQLGYPVTIADIEDRLRLMEAAVLVAESEGEVIGCLSTSVMHVLHRPAPVGRISMMVVDEAHRGRGFGAQMVG
jgi:N-acetylglutamate synthase-like GNAT family acetyltransferase